MARLVESEQVEFVDESAITCDLVQAMASDAMVVNAARVSHDRDLGNFISSDEELTDKDRRLIGFLMENRHGTPFEHNAFTFLVSAPIAVVREHHRHRIGHAYNEVSGRYTKLAPRFFVPGLVRMDSADKNKYAFTYASDPLADEVRDHLATACANAYQDYERLLDLGVKREVARGVLPVYTMTRYYWTCNARSLMHFLSLRLQQDAMEEIRIVARHAYSALRDLMPTTYLAFSASGWTAP